MAAAPLVMIVAAGDKSPCNTHDRRAAPKESGLFVVMIAPALPFSAA